VGLIFSTLTETGNRDRAWVGEDSTWTLTVYSPAHDCREWLNRLPRRIGLKIRLPPQP